MRQFGVCVYGGSSNSADKIYYQAAFDLGAGLAKRGWRLVNGAGDTGVMGAAIRGVESQGGDYMGIAPFFFKQPGVLYNEGQDTIFTRTMRERKAFMEALSNAFVAAPGGIGTLEELYEIMTLKQLGQLEAPLILLNLNHYYDSLLKAMNDMKEAGFISPSTMELFIVLDSVEDTLNYLEQEFAKEAQQ